MQQNGTFNSSSATSKAERGSSWDLWGRESFLDIYMYVQSSGLRLRSVRVLISLKEQAESESANCARGSERCQGREERCAGAASMTFKS